MTEGVEVRVPNTTSSLDQIAIIGMAGRFPGAPTLAHFWKNLSGGVESVSFFSRDELLAAGVSQQMLARRQYVAAKGVLDDSNLFDARYFDLSTREAMVMDPQFRVFLETVVEAMEDAGYAADDASRRTGIFAGAGTNTYHEYLRACPELVETVGTLQAVLLNEKDFLPTWAAYKLNLTGPCVAVQSACATSLVAVHMACQSLLNGECDIAIAGAVSLSFPQRAGYLYVEGGLWSPDGHCRAFDAKTLGSVPGEGVGVVVLRRLGDAIEQGDAIRAIVRASSINNDGSDKISFLAPSEKGIATAVTESIAIAGIDCESIRYVEAHGTGAPLADPIEIASLAKSFRAHTSKKEFCAIGSVKTNIGHLDTAAGIASLIKTVLALENGVIPPSLNCDEPNPLMKFSQTPFYVARQAEDWGRNGKPRLAAVNSFGIGGTNAHLILEEAPPRVTGEKSLPDQLLVLSARSEGALIKVSENLADNLSRSPETSLSAVAFTLGVGRRAHEFRRFVVGGDLSGAVAALKADKPGTTARAGAELEDRVMTFIFPDRGAEYAGLASDIYRDEPVFRQAFDQCATTSNRLLRINIRSLIQPPSGNGSYNSHLLARSTVSAAFSVAVEYALAQLLMSWGVRPQAVMAEGTGEYTGACIAGALSIEEAMSLAILDEMTGNGTSHVIALTANSSRQAIEDRVLRLAFFSSSHGKWLGPVYEPPAGSRAQAPRNRAAFEAAIEAENRVLLEVGLSSASSEFEKLDSTIIPTLRGRDESISVRARLLNALGELWLAGIPIDFQALNSNQQCRRVPLPTYPFERQLYWAESIKTDDGAMSPLWESSDEQRPTVRGSAADGSEEGEPSNDLQAVLAVMWATYLGIDRVGIHDGFFELGGNSIAATRIVMTIRETLQVDLPLRSILDHPTVASLAEEIEKVAQQFESDVHQIARVVREIHALPAHQVEERLAGA